MAGRVFVAYGSKFGATAEIAAAIGKALRSAGLEVDVEPPSDVRSLDAYRAGHGEDDAARAPGPARKARDRRLGPRIAAALTG
jgi:hypothetical protein